MKILRILKIQLLGLGIPMSFCTSSGFDPVDLAFLSLNLSQKIYKFRFKFKA